MEIIYKNNVIKGTPEEIKEFLDGAKEEKQPKVEVKEKDVVVKKQMI